ncbi:TRAP transporter substrate-binding protein DctP [Dehalococcoidia bacterium]|nr:TRAP transporter substrate-binding protein DctP [Dehalococcoidia bacterium]
MKRKMLLIPLALLLAMSLVAIGCPPQQPPAVMEEVETFHLKFSTAYPPPPSATAVTNVWVMDEITRRTDGRVTFDKFWGGAIHTVRESLDAIGGGIVDLGEAPLGAWPDRAPLAHLGQFAFPFGPSDPVMTARISLQMLDEFPEYSEQLADDNAKVLAVWMWDTYDILSTVPLRSLDDFVGLTVGAWGVYFPKWLEAIGAAGISSPSPERYELLVHGLIDATWHPLEAHVANKVYEVTRYYTFLAAGVAPTMDVIMNLDTWAKLPPDIQQIFLDVYREAMVRHGELLLGLRDELQAYLEEQGIIFYTFPDAAREEWMLAIPDLTEEWVSRVEALGYPGKRMARRWMEVSEEMGHVWHPGQLQKWAWLLEE